MVAPSSMAVPVCVVRALSPEVHLHSFAFLTFGDLVCVARTCMQWRDTTKDETLFRSLVERTWGFLSVPKPPAPVVVPKGAKFTFVPKKEVDSDALAAEAANAEQERQSAINSHRGVMFVDHKAVAAAASASAAESVVVDATIPEGFSWRLFFYERSRSFRQFLSSANEEFEENVREQKKICAIDKNAAARFDAFLSRYASNKLVFICRA